MNGQRYTPDTFRAMAVNEPRAMEFFVPNGTYEMYYVDNLRTGAMHMVAIMSGADAANTLSRSTAPKRLRFRQI